MRMPDMLLIVKWYFIAGVVMYVLIVAFEFLINKDDPDADGFWEQLPSLKETLLIVIFWPKFLWEIVIFVVFTTILLL